MKILKISMLVFILAALCISIWVYYPKYQINQMKKQAIYASSEVEKTSYIDYFRSSETGSLQHLAIGDSVIKGYGASPEEGLVYQFSSQLEEKTGKTVTFQNAGINGITSDELNSLVQSGQFDDAIRKADIITLNIGGNDVLQVARKQDFSNAFRDFDRLQSNFSQNLNSIVSKINQLNPNAALVLLELYNPLKPENSLFGLAEKLLPKWNVKIYEAANRNPGILVVETTKVINGKNLQNLSPDGVHPNSNGYSAISKQMLSQFMTQPIPKAV